MAFGKNKQATCLCNCNYNVMRQLTKKLSFLTKVDQYIQDAKRDGHPECAAMWEHIKADEDKHAKMMRDMVAKLAQDGKLV